MDRSVLKFEEAIKSEATKKLYKIHLNSFLKFTKIKEAEGLLQLKDSFLQELMEDYLFSLKKRLNPNSIPQRFAALELFFAMNDKILNFKKIKKMYPAAVKTTGRDYWTTSDIQKMLGVSKTKRMTAFIHFLASTGCRIGTIPELKLKHMKEIENCKAIVLYPGSIEEYVGFLTPEASLAMDDYLDKRRADGEILTDESPLFRKTYAIGSAKARPVNAGSMKHLAIDMMSRANVTRTRENSPRFNIQILHGFRKRFNNTLKDYKEGNIALKEKLMGHKGAVDLDGRYHNPPILTLFEEFKIHIPNLTINDADRERAEKNKAMQELSSVQQDKAIMRNLAKEMEEVKLQQARHQVMNEQTKKENDELLKKIADLESKLNKS